MGPRPVVPYPWSLSVATEAREGTLTTQPIPPRAGRPAPDDMRSKLSPATRPLLIGWLDTRLIGVQGENVERAVMVAAGLDLDLPDGRPDWAYGQVLSYISKGDEELLDAIHVTLCVLRSGRVVYRHPPWQEVDRILTIGRSAWKATEEGLVHRANPTAQAAFERAVGSGDDVGEELQEAWTNAYSRDSDASLTPGTTPSRRSSSSTSRPSAPPRTRPTSAAWRAT